MVLVAFAVGGFPAVFFCASKAQSALSYALRLGEQSRDKGCSGCVCLYVRKKVFRSFSSFRMELFVGEQSCCVENRKVIMFASYNKTALCRLAFISNFDFAKISRK